MAGLFDLHAFEISIILFAVLLFVTVPRLMQWLWNTTIPQVLGLKPVTYWQAVRLLVIGFLLFGGPWGG